MDAQQANSFAVDALALNDSAIAAAAADHDDDAEVDLGALEGGELEESASSSPLPAPLVLSGPPLRGGVPADTDADALAELPAGRSGESIDMPTGSHALVFIEGRGPFRLCFVDPEEHGSDNDES